MEQPIYEGTPQELAPFLAWRPQSRFRLIELSEEPEAPATEAPLADPKAAASIALLKSWIAQAPTDIHAELHDELQAAGFQVGAGQMGENITTRGLDLLGLPRGTRLHLGDTAVIEVTGLRNPCAQLDAFRPGLLAAVLGRDEHGNLVRKVGIMGIVLAEGEVRPGDAIRVTLPPEPHQSLERV